jgi:hypothetical protein
MNRSRLEKVYGAQDFLKLREATPRSIANPAKAANPSDTGPATPSNALAGRLRLHRLDTVLWIIS